MQQFQTEQDQRHEPGRVMLAPRDMYLYTMADTPVVSRLNNIPVQIGMAVLANRLSMWTNPNLPRPLRNVIGLAWYALFTLAETLHTVGHILSARRAGAPMDAVTWQYGLQINTYYNTDVPPQQHIGRASGGLLMSGTMTLLAYGFWRLVARVPVLGALAKGWLACNAILFGGSLTPTPMFDAGMILKQAVTLRTGEPALGEEAVQQAGFAVVFGLLLAAPILLLRGKVLLALGALIFAGFVTVDMLILRGRLP